MKRSSDGAISNKLQPSTPPPLVAKACRSHPRVKKRSVISLFVRPFWGQEGINLQLTSTRHPVIVQSWSPVVSNILKYLKPTGLAWSVHTLVPGRTVPLHLQRRHLWNLWSTGLVDLDISYLQGKKCLKWVISPVLAIVIGNMMILTTRFTMISGYPVFRQIDLTGQITIFH